MVYDYTAPSEIFERLEGVSVCLTNKTCFPKEVLEKLPDLKYIGCLSTGFNVVDVEYCREHGITVTNIPEYATFATAQMTIALLLEIANKVGHHSDLVHEGVWTRGRDFCFWDGHEISECGGSTWFCDTHWMELDKNCLGYINIDNLAIMDTSIPGVESLPELKEYLMGLIREVWGTDGVFHQAYKGGGDSSFFGVGVPYISFATEYTEEQLKGAYEFGSKV